MHVHIELKFISTLSEKCTFAQNRKLLPLYASHIFFINPAYKARVLVQPFRSRRDPANWGRVVTFLQFAAGELLQVATGAFVDDVFCVEEHRLAMSGFPAFKQLCEIIGAPTSNKKDRPPAAWMVLLGADVVYTTDTYTPVRERIVRAD